MPIIFENDEVVVTVSGDRDLQIKSKQHPMIQLYVMISSHHLRALAPHGDHKVSTDRTGMDSSVSIRTWADNERE